MYNVVAACFLLLMVFVLSMIKFLYAAWHDNVPVGCVTLNGHRNLLSLPRMCSELSDWWCIKKSLFFVLVLAWLLLWVTGISSGWLDRWRALFVPLFGRSVGFLVGWLAGWSFSLLFVLQGNLFGRFVQLFSWLLCCSVCFQSVCIFLGQLFGQFLRPSGEVLKLYIALSTLSVLPYISAKWGKNCTLFWSWNQYNY
jgi:hypothetical protein